MPRTKIKSNPRAPKSATDKREKHTDTFYDRVDFVLGLFCENPIWLQSKRATDLNEVVCKKLSVKGDMATKYISAARDLWRTRAEEKREDKIRKAINQRDALARRALKLGDLRTALAAYKERDVIEGIYIELSTDPAPVRRIVKVKGLDGKVMTIEEVINSKLQSKNEN